MNDEPEDVTILLAGSCCRTCERPMLFHPLITIDSDSGSKRTRAKVDTQIIHKALWSLGAVEIAPGMWLCWLCSSEKPDLKLAGEEVRHRYLKPDVVGVSSHERAQWGKKS